MAAIMNSFPIKNPNFVMLHQEVVKAMADGSAVQFNRREPKKEEYWEDLDPSQYSLINPISCPNYFWRVKQTTRRELCIFHLTEILKNIEEGSVLIDAVEMQNDLADMPIGGQFELRPTGLKILKIVFHKRRENEKD